MKDQVNFVKATVIGGVFFLVPIAVVLVVVGKLVYFMREVARSLDPLLPLDTHLGP